MEYMTTTFNCVLITLSESPLFPVVDCDMCAQANRTHTGRSPLLCCWLWRAGKHAHARTDGHSHMSYTCKHISTETWCNKTLLLCEFEAQVFFQYEDRSVWHISDQRCISTSRPRSPYISTTESVHLDLPTFGRESCLFSNIFVVSH